MLVYITRCGSDSDTVPDFCIDLDGFGDLAQPYFKRVYNSDVSGEQDCFYFFSDKPITDEVMMKFWCEFHGEDYVEPPI